MGKGYKEGLCIYCMDRDAEEGEHVIAREFFLKNKRDNLPKVPTCKDCNHAKSLLEHALTAVLPFGGTHSDAAEALAMTERRLANNNSLHASLANGVKNEWRTINGESSSKEMTIPLKGQDVEKLFEFIVKGLAHHHWKLNFGSDHLVRASFLTQSGRQLFDPLFGASSPATVKGNFGDGAFTYEAVQAEECAEFTLWKMSMYGLEVRRDECAPMERSTMVYGFTTPKNRPAAGALLSMLNR